jgi:hypothetical protein
MTVASLYAQLRLADMEKVEEIAIDCSALDQNPVLMDRLLRALSFKP